MAETKVSDEFNEFYQNESAAIQKTKEAEARMSDIPVDVDTEGSCMVTDISFGKTPDTTKKEGCLFCRVGFRIIDSPPHNGKRLQRTWWIYKNADTTRAESLKSLLDYLENRMGLPRDLRMSHTSPKELGDFYQQNNIVLHFQVKAAREVNEYNDGKELHLNVPKDIIPVTDSVLPPTQTATTPTSTTTPTSSGLTQADLVAGDMVMHMDEKWEVNQPYKDKVEIKNCQTGRQKLAPYSAVEKL